MQSICSSSPRDLIASFSGSMIWEIMNREFDDSVSRLFELGILLRYTTFVGGIRRSSMYRLATSSEAGEFSLTTTTVFSGPKAWHELRFAIQGATRPATKASGIRSRLRCKWTVTLHRSQSSKASWGIESEERNGTPYPIHSSCQTSGACPGKTTERRDSD